MRQLNVFAAIFIISSYSSAQAADGKWQLHPREFTAAVSDPTVTLKENRMWFRDQEVDLNGKTIVTDANAYDSGALSITECLLNTIQAKRINATQVLVVVARYTKRSYTGGLACKNATAADISKYGDPYNYERYVVTLGEKEPTMKALLMMDTDHPDVHLTTQELNDPQLLQKRPSLERAVRKYGLVYNLTTSPSTPEQRIEAAHIRETERAEDKRKSAGDVPHDGEGSI